jgi:hypothetical protein
MEKLGYQCPVVQFASVQCTKDAYDLMDSTVMPLIKQQLIALKSSSLVVVYHKNNMTEFFRSYIVPATIKRITMAFLLQQDPGIDRADNSSSIYMTFGHGGNDNEALFGSIKILDLWHVARTTASVSSS